MNKKSFKCPECSKSFGLARVLGAHRFREHGVKGSAPSALLRAKRKRANKQLELKENPPNAGAAITIQEAIAGLEMKVQVTLEVINELKALLRKGKL